MAKDYEPILDTEGLSDQELGELIRQQLEERQGIDPARLEIEVRSGRVSVSGRVGTEGERQQVETMLADVLDLPEYENAIVVDELVREEHSDAADEATVEAAASGSPLGEAKDETDPAAAHLREDVEGDLHGTHDPQKAVERGQSYAPPDGSIQEGTRSEENH